MGLRGDCLARVLCPRLSIVHESRGLFLFFNVFSRVLFFITLRSHPLCASHFRLRASMQHPESSRRAAEIAEKKPELASFILPGFRNLLRIKIIFFQNIYGKLRIYVNIIRR